MTESRTGRSAASSDPHGKRLDSWKEIATYLKRDVTTVRRWEKLERLPVHRHQHAMLGSVYAFTQEIDDWQAAREQLPQLEQPPLIAGLRPRLVGRERELRRLRDRFERACQGKREVVFIAGEVGIGKTALTQTFVEEVRSEIWLVAGQSVEHYGKGEAYLPILEGLARIARNGPNAEAVKVIEQLAPSWADQLCAKSQRPSRRRSITGDSAGGHIVVELVDVIEALASLKPVVLLLEDLHWSDQSTVEFVARLARRPERARLLLIGTYRPTELFDIGSPLLRIGRELRVHFQADEIELAPLSEDAVGELISLERTWNDPKETAASLRQWSGNPLFLIHFIDHLQNAGRITERAGKCYVELDRDDRPVPDSLRILIEEHIDRLGGDERRLLEIASVVGATFPAAVVARATADDVTIVERSFENLCRRSHLVTREETAIFPDGTASAAYAFVHELYRQVVYERLPEATLAQLHQRIGSELETAYGARATEISSELALHFERGRDSPRALGHYWTVAENALARNADREAQIALSKASELVVQLPSGKDRERIELRLREQIDSVAERCAERMVSSTPVALGLDTVAGEAGDLVGGSAPMGGLADVRTSDLVDAVIRLSVINCLQGDLTAAKEIGDRAAVIGNVQRRSHFEAVGQQAFVRLLAGEFAESRTLAGRALAIADRDRIGKSDYRRVQCLIVLAWTNWYLGLYEELRSLIEHILSDTPLSGRPTALLLTPLIEWLGESDRRAGELRSHLEHEGRVELSASPFPPRAIKGWFLVRQHYLEMGLRILQENVQELRTKAMYSWLPGTLVWLADALQANGQAEAAVGAAEEGLHAVRRTGARCCDAELYRVRGEAMMLRPQYRLPGAAVDAGRDAAEASFWAGITTARQQKARTLELRSTLSLCRLLRGAGRHEEARRTLAPLYEEFVAGDQTPDLQEAKRLLS